MRILHIVTSLGGGGAEHFVGALVPRVSGDRTRCAIMTVYPSEVPAAVTNADGVDVLQLHRRGRYDAGFLARMVAAIRAWRPDIVHTHMHHGTYWGRLAALAAGVRAIVRTEHLPCDTVARLPGTALPNRLLNGATAAVVTFTREQGEFLAAYEHFDAAKLVVIPNGIEMREAPTPGAHDRARALLGIAPEQRSIVVLGNLHRHKNQQLALDMLGELPACVRATTRLLFVGDGNDRPALEAHARALGLDDAVTFLGYRRDVATLLPGADLLAMPSLTEGMPLALLEAMRADVPIVSTPWIGVRELLGDGARGLIASDFRPASLAACVLQAFSEGDATIERVRTAGVAVRTEYAIDTCAERHRRLYAGILGHRLVA